MFRAKVSSPEKFYDEIVNQFIEKCTLCGDCVRCCPLIPQTPLKDENPEEIIRKIIYFLKHRTYSTEVFLKVFSCASCGKCSRSCPEGLDTLMAFEATKLRLAKEGNIPEAVKYIKESLGIWRILSDIQIKPSERRWLNAVPYLPEKVENVVFLGCTLPAFPHTVFALLDVFKRTGVDFIALGGGELCCGFPYGPAAGQIQEAEKKARELVTSVKAFSPRRVILTCAGCYRMFTELYPQFLDLDFEIQYYAQFLYEKINDVCLSRPLNKKVILHESCMSQRTRVTEWEMKLMSKLPNLEVTKARDICCGGTPRLTFPQMAQKMADIFRETLTKEVMEARVDYLVNICQLCRMAIYPHMSEFSFFLKDLPTLINESMEGKEYQNKWEIYWKCKNIDEIIEKSRENFEENGLTETEVRRVLPFIFTFYD
ncbi:MAG: (Fe-S)-binding protein [Methanomassiliicoccales archaeon]